MSDRSGHPPHVPDRDLEEVVAERLVGAGQRLTAKRRALLASLAGAGRPVTTVEIVALARLPLSSVYRNLVVLERAGVVRRLTAAGGVARYELAEGLTAHHHHLVCASCGRVQDFSAPKGLEQQVERALADAASRAGFAPESHRIDLIGLCSRCR